MKSFQVEVSVNGDSGETLNVFVDHLCKRLQQTVEEAVAKSLATIPKQYSTIGESEASKRGIMLPADERIKAADLRTELLLGKLPVDAGLLIDLKTVARLLNISARTFHRLCLIEAAPAAVRMGSLVRWRLAELLEWIDAGCPAQKHWTYSSGSTKPKRR